MNKHLKIERRIREHTDHYGKAGEVEWFVVDFSVPDCPQVVDVFRKRYLAKEMIDYLNRSLP